MCSRAYASSYCWAPLCWPHSVIERCTFIKAVKSQTQYLVSLSTIAHPIPLGMGSQIAPTRGSYQPRACAFWCCSGAFTNGSGAGAVTILPPLLSQLGGLQISSCRSCCSQASSTSSHRADAGWRTALQPPSALTPPKGAFPSGSPSGSTGSRLGSAVSCGQAQLQLRSRLRSL